jgi:mRNA-degrading endonuclease RelE of RelBE toxin-antitoxin system
MSKEIEINYLPSFERMLKRLKLNSCEIKSQIEMMLQEFVDNHPESYYFPKSGSGIGNVWKLRVGGSGGFRILYYALPKTRHFDILLIFPKSKQSNLSAEQIKIIKKIIKQLEV